MSKFKASGVSSEVFTPDKLQVTGPYAAKSITIEEDSAAADLSRGHLMAKSGSKFVPLAAAETTVTSEEVYTMADATFTYEAGDTDPIVKPFVYAFILANPPVPGTLALVTDDASALAFGTDNGEGVGSGADGSFTVDYETGKVVVTLNHDEAIADGKKILASYKTRGAGLPDCILAEPVAKVDVDDDDVVSLAYTKGTFLASALTGYSAGYKLHLRKLGIELE